MKTIYNVSIAFVISVSIGCAFPKHPNYRSNNLKADNNINLDSIVRTPEKKRQLHDYLLKTYWIEENIKYTPYVVVRESLFFDIGVYNFSQNSARFMGVHYLINYKDTVVFVPGSDTLKLHFEIDKFLSTYDDKLSPKNKETLKDEKKIWR